jgi:hypothetical protein
MSVAKDKAEPKSGGALTVGARASLGWLLVTLGLWNSCSSHEESRASDAALSGGKYALTPAFAVQALRGAGTDDTDVARYLAYANATLGRPYRSYFVRPVEGWAPSAPGQTAGEGNTDPALSAMNVPDRPLVPYRDFSVEYPPGFLLLVLAPALLVSGLDGYRLVFSLLMGLFLGGALLVTVHAGRELAVDGRPLVTGATWLALALGTIAVRRFDAVVSLSLCVALWGAMTRRPLVVGVALGIGAACKVVPLAVAPLVLVYWAGLRRWREIGIATAAGALAMLVTCLPFFLAAGSHVVDMFRYHAARPFEAGSTGAALLSTFRAVDPGAAAPVEEYGAVDIVGPAQRVLLPLSTVLLAAAVFTIVVWCARHTRASSAAPGGTRMASEALWRAACATLAVSIALGKVLSSQYLVWLLPCGVLACVLDGPKHRTSLLILGAAMLLTQLNQHVLTAMLKNGSPLLGLLVLLRNGLLLTWGVRVLRMDRGGDAAHPLRSAEPVGAP